MYSDIYLFGTPVKKHEIIPTQDQFEDLNNHLYNFYSQSKVGSWAQETGKSTGEFDLYLHHFKKGNWLWDSALEYASEFWKELDYRNNAKIQIDSCWANLHQYGHATGEHSHCGGSVRAHISAVYYLKKPENSGNIEFIDPLEYIHKMSPKHLYDETFNSNAHPIVTKQFDFILFPSWLKHRTQKNLSQDDRVAISINFIGIW